MICHNCVYKRREEGAPAQHVQCRAIREHHVFRNMDAEEKGSLELYAAATGQFPYSTPDGQPLVKLDREAALGDCNWPKDFHPAQVMDCKLYTLKPDIAGFASI